MSSGFQCMIAINLEGKNHDETVLVLRCDEMTRESCVDLRTGPEKVRCLHRTHVHSIQLFETQDQAVAWI